jgi:threonine dehydratase
VFHGRDFDEAREHCEPLAANRGYRYVHEGPATRVGFELPQRILREQLADFVLVSDEEIRSAMLHMLERTRNLIEAAGASPLAAALKLRNRLAGKRVEMVASGGNVGLDQLRALL